MVRSKRSAQLLIFLFSCPSFLNLSEKANHSKQLVQTCPQSPPSLPQQTQTDMPAGYEQEYVRHVQSADCIKLNQQSSYFRSTLTYAGLCDINVFLNITTKPHEAHWKLKAHSKQGHTPAPSGNLLFYLCKTVNWEGVHVVSFYRRGRIMKEPAHLPACLPASHLTTPRPDLHNRFLLLSLAAVDPPPQQPAPQIPSLSSSTWQTTSKDSCRNNKQWLKWTKLKAQAHTVVGAGTPGSAKSPPRMGVSGVT